MALGVSRKLLKEFLHLESAGGILLVIAAILAMVLVNSPFDFIYNALLEIPVEIRIGAIEVAKPLLLWINDGLMAIFFLLIGLEVKREVLEGQLSELSQVVLPGVAALGGVVVPALVYVMLNQGDATAMRGWAIPTATDIAFALGILALLGSRVPSSLKLFLLTLAILDDLAAIIIIAVFYSHELSVLSMGLASAALLIMVILNRLHVSNITIYILLGVCAWVFVLKSGVHATLAGVAVAFTIPLKVEKPAYYSPLKHLEHKLHPWVAFMIVPVFAFANAGVPISGGLDLMFTGIPMGIALGLLVGKPLGVFGASWLLIKSGFAKLPSGANWSQLFGVSVLCGIGFTMSLFIGSLSFDQNAADYAMQDRIGILIGSFFAAVIGVVWLYLAGKPNPDDSGAGKGH
ncbi:Na+/H+ antiporter NhaA [Balneatrix alpica]|uniref:Na+/H+ antiporter NhaA n=1 Tax=Balneatrix alpica TaxID=75684 RepID=UPI00273891E7|nr:Na+/H+ antiporter NhaA [Balneatrix alpica]